MWSKLASRVSAASTSKDAVSLAKETLVAHASVFANPLQQEPVFESPPSTSTPAPAAVDASQAQLLADQLAFYRIEPETSPRLLLASCAQDKLDLDAFLDTHFPLSPSSSSSASASAAAASPQVRQHAQALALVLNERRAVLTALLNLYSSSGDDTDGVLLGECKRSLVLEHNLLVNACSTAHEIQEHVHHLLSSPAHRGALEYQSQIAQLLWERGALFQLVFYICCGGSGESSSSSLRVQDLAAVFKLLGAVSIAPGGLAEPVSGAMMPTGIDHQQQLIMTRPIEALRDWAQLEKSYTLDCVSYCMFSSLRLWQTFQGDFPAAEAISIFHDGLEALTMLGWCFYRQRLSQSSSDAHELRMLLRPTTDKRALAFLRCVQRSTEFRALQARLGAPVLTEIAAELLAEVMAFVAERAAEAEGLGAADKQRAGGDGAMSDDDDDAGELVDALYAPRRAQSGDGAATVSNVDSLEDVMECVAQVCDAYVAAAGAGSGSDYAIAFFTPRTKQFAFLQHCAKAADRAVYFKLLACLAAAKDCQSYVANWLSSSSSLSSSSRSFYAETLQMVTAAASPTMTSTVVVAAGDKELHRRLVLLSRLGGHFPQHADYVVPCLALLAGSSSSSASACGALVLLTALCSRPGSQDAVLVHWRRHVYFAGDALQQGEIRFNAVQAHVAPTSCGTTGGCGVGGASYKLTVAFLDFIQAMLATGRLDQASSAVLLQFTVEVVFLRLDSNAVPYAVPGERWELCLGCLAVLCTALDQPSSSSSSSAAAAWVRAVFLRESVAFTTLMGVLNAALSSSTSSSSSSAQRESAAEALERYVRLVARWPAGAAAASSGRSAAGRPEWFLAGKRASSLDAAPVVLRQQQQQFRGEPASSYGMLRTSQQQASSVVRDWLLDNDDAAATAAALVFDDGDRDSLFRLHSVKLALVALRLLMGGGDATAPSSPQLKLSTLLFSHSEVYVSAVASYVGFSLDSECQDAALVVLDYLACQASNPEQQVFLWIHPTHFLQHHTSQRMFAFLCRHQPAVLLKHSVGFLFRVVQHGQLVSGVVVDAVRTLSLVPAGERARLAPGFSARVLLRRYLDCISTEGGAATSRRSQEVVLGLSWTLRLLLQTGEGYGGGGFEETVLHVALNALPHVPEAASHLLHSWRLYAEQCTTTNLVALVGGMQRALSTNTTTSGGGVVLDLASASLTLMKRQVTNNTCTPSIGGQEEEELVRAVSSALVVRSPQNELAYAYELSLLLLLLQTSTRKMALQRAVHSAAERITDVCAQVCIIQQQQQQHQEAASAAGALRAIAAAAFIELFPLVRHTRLDIYSRRGVFHGMLANVTAAAAAGSSSSSSQELLLLLSVLEFVALDSREGTMALADNLAAAAAATTTITSSSSSATFVRLWLNMSLHDARLGAKFVTSHRAALLGQLKDVTATTATKKKDSTTRRMVVDLLCRLKQQGQGDGEDDAQMDEAVRICFAAAVDRSHHHHNVAEDRALARACVMYLIQSPLRAASSSSSSVLLPRTSEIATLCKWLALLIQQQTTTTTTTVVVGDVEKALLLLWYTLRPPAWSAKEDFPVLVALFPVAVGRAGAQQTPSPLERFIDQSSSSDKESLLRVLRDRLCELRFQ